MDAVLVVDDESNIRDVVCFALKGAGFNPLEAQSGEEAIELFNKENPTLIVLDIGMPGMDGFEVCRQLRQDSSVPIIFLSAFSEEIDRVQGLEIGGDDYITKPFSPRELVIRVKNVLRRLRETPLESRKEEAGQSGVIERGRLRVDCDRFKVFWNESELVFSVTEFGMIRAMLSGLPDQVFERDQLMDKSYQRENHVVSHRTIDSHIRRIRNKFKAVGASPIETVHGRGYRLGPCD